MDWIAGLVLIGLIVYLMRQLSPRRAARTESPPPPSVTVSLSTSAGPSTLATPRVGTIKAVGATNYWVLNPEADAPVTVSAADRTQAEALKRLLDRGFQEYGGDYDRELTAFLLRTNVRWGELDTYLERARVLYRKSVDAQRRASPEWADAGERDREDLLQSFRQSAIASLDVRPYADLVTLLEDEPTDATLDDALIAEYGFEPIALYLRNAHRMDHVFTVPADAREREMWERLDTLGLAARGTAIPIADILAQWTLKDMNALGAEAGLSIFRRKTPAIEALVALPDIQRRVGAKIAWRELFQLRPLPEKYQHLELATLSRSWRYAREVADLLKRDYTTAGHATQNRKMQETLKVSYWELLPAPDACPACQRAAQARYHSSIVLGTPLHPGCRCVANAAWRERVSGTLQRKAPICELAARTTNRSASSTPSKSTADIRTVGLEAQKRSTAGKAQFALSDGFEGTVEEIALHFYEQQGWRGVWTENHFWWMALALLFWDVYFADVPGAWDPMLRQTGVAADMPRDLFQPEFFANRAPLIKARLAALQTADVVAELSRIHREQYGKPCRIIEGWDRFGLPVLQAVLARMPRAALLQLLHRLLQDFNHHRRGLPDLVLYRDAAVAFIEVKGPRDKVTPEQETWLCLLQEWGLEVWVTRVNDSQTN